MEMILVETRAFTERVKELLDDETYRLFQNELVRDPTKGQVIPGCGGLRKIRVSNPKRDKGKRGGLRAIYLNLPEVARIVLVALYSKNEQEDLAEDEKKMLRALAARLRQEAIQSRYRGKEGR
jgi:hypothetical protein